MGQNNPATNFRIGFGVDIHQLVKGRPLIIGGVKIEATKGALGHSDADVLIHAICDALLGALALGDIGQHFPDTDPQYKGIDSTVLLIRTYQLLSKHGFAIGNLDATVLLETPKLSHYVPLMRENIASILQVETDQVSVKATRGEKMGYIGKEEGIQAYCTALVYKLS